VAQLTDNYAKAVRTVKAADLTSPRPLQVSE
jgi:hypothetical protein